MSHTKMVLGMVGIVLLVAAAPIKGGAATDSLDTNAIEHAIGKAGELKDKVYKISLPRKDLSVSVNGVKLKPGFALGSWIAFEESGNEAVMDGDLVLTENEVGPVLTQLRKEGIEVSAVHNHLIGETPRVMYVHVAGKGKAALMAAHLKGALNLTGTPLEAAAANGRDNAAKGATEETGFDAELIQEELGHQGKAKDGVLHVSVPRPETITMHGAALPPSMGMATAINFQSTGEKKVAATGDFVMVSAEVDRVSKALTEHGILITALHNHLVHGSPDLYFMHFWAVDSAEKVAKGLRAGLDALKKG
jgi:hypothetical protein